ncbi:hypothetical protein [Niallia circulans]|uniref:hypothetical protein n=1 Tax=Niallia circulans TaxID=1397 RepID=UPI00128E6B01|nr:hypothetical protein [Niallia circulans]
MDNIKELREQLWKLIYLTPLTPGDLIENAKDPSYHNVNFKHLDNGLEVELIFTDNGDLVTTTYIFNKDDQLQEILMSEFNRISVLYNRQDEINLLLSKITAHTQLTVAI